MNEAPLKPKPVNGRPPIFQGGNSKAARKMAAKYSDWYFINGNTIEGFKEQIEDVKALAKKEGRENEIKFAANGFAIVRDTEEEAVELLRDIVSHADTKAVEGFKDAVKEAGQSTQDKSGMWANSTLKDLVQYNDGFKTGLIGTAEQVANKII